MQNFKQNFYQLFLKTKDCTKKRWYSKIVSRKIDVLKDSKDQPDTKTSFYLLTMSYWVRYWMDNKNRDVATWHIDTWQSSSTPHPCENDWSGTDKMSDKLIRDWSPFRTFDRCLISAWSESDQTLIRPNRSFCTAPTKFAYPVESAVRQLKNGILGLSFKVELWN